MPNSTTQEVRPTQLGWRFATGVVLIVGGYAAWSLIPIAVTTDLSPAAKSVLTAVLGATPFLTKVVAVAIMGRPAYAFLKRTVANYVWAGRTER